MLVKRLYELKNNLDSVTYKEFFVRFLLVLIGNKIIVTIVEYISENIGFSKWNENALYYLIYLVYLFWGVNWIVEKYHRTITSSPSSLLSSVSNFCFSSKNQKEIFEPIINDWQEEYFEALFKKEVWKARWINVRYTCAFLAAMWMKSPIGDVIEFISKLAK